jgi:hypothetical protein
LHEGIVRMCHRRPVHTCVLATTSSVGRLDALLQPRARHHTQEHENNAMDHGVRKTGHAVCRKCCRTAPLSTHHVSTPIFQRLRTERQEPAATFLRNARIKIDRMSGFQVARRPGKAALWSSGRNPIGNTPFLVGVPKVAYKYPYPTDIYPCSHAAPLRRRHGAAGSSAGAGVCVFACCCAC